MKSRFLTLFALALTVSSLSAFADGYGRGPGHRPGHGHDHDRPVPPSPVMSVIQCTEMRAHPGRELQVTINYSRRAGYEASVSRGRMMLGFFDHLDATERMGGTTYYGRDFSLNVAMVGRGDLIGSLDAVTGRFERIVAQDMRCYRLR